MTLSNSKKKVTWKMLNLDMYPATLRKEFKVPRHDVYYAVT